MRYLSIEAVNVEEFHCVLLVWMSFLIQFDHIATTNFTACLWQNIWSITLWKIASLPLPGCAVLTNCKFSLSATISGHTGKGSMCVQVYMMVFKVLQQKRPVAFKNFHLKQKQHQYDRYQNFFDHFSNYRYCDSVDLMYTTKEIMYDKTVNTRLINYRKSNKQYV